MKKLKVYLDTSVIIHLDQQDASDKMKQTKELWEILKSDEYDIVIGETVIEAIGKRNGNNRNLLNDYLTEINYQYVLNSNETKELAVEIINMKILNQMNFDDCLNIATAILNDCNIIVSWNFKHMVNVEVINGIRKIAIVKRNKTIDIYPPNYFIIQEEDEEDNEKRIINKPVLSDNFTIEDIHKIREYNYELRKTMSPEDYRKLSRERAERALKHINEVRNRMGKSDIVMK